MAEDGPSSPGTAVAPPVLGEGCARRFDPQALGEEAGSEFAEAEALWRRLQQAGGEQSEG